MPGASARASFTLRAEHHAACGPRPPLCSLDPHPAGCRSCPVSHADGSCAECYRDETHGRAIATTSPSVAAHLPSVTPSPGGGDQRWRAGVQQYWSTPCSDHAKRSCRGHQVHTLVLGKTSADNQAEWMTRFAHTRRTGPLRGCRYSATGQLYPDRIRAEDERGVTACPSGRERQVAGHLASIRSVMQEAMCMQADGLAPLIVRV